MASGYTVRESSSAIYNFAPLSNGDRLLKERICLGGGGGISFLQEFTPLGRNSLSRKANRKSEAELSNGDTSKHNHSPGPVIREVTDVFFLKLTKKP